MNRIDPALVHPVDARSIPGHICGRIRLPLRSSATPAVKKSRPIHRGERGESLREQVD